MNVELPYLWCIVVLLPQKRFFERFWMNLSSPLTVPYNRRTREESLSWKGSSAGAIFPPKIASLRFQTSQHKGQKIHDSSRMFQSKIHPNGPELAVEESQNPTVFERLECVARFMIGCLENDDLENEDLRPRKRRPRKRRPRKQRPRKQRPRKRRPRKQWPRKRRPRKWRQWWGSSKD